MPSPFYNTEGLIGLRKLLGTSKVHDIGTGIAALGEDVEKYLLGRVGVSTPEVTAASGQLLLLEENNIKVNLPSAKTDNQIVGVLSHFAAATISAADNIYGGTGGGAKTLKLGLYQCVILQSAGGFWNIIAGAPNGLNLKASGTSGAAARGELVKATAAITVTSPEAAENAIFGVLANGHAVTVKAAAGGIYGDFIEGATSANLVGYQHIVLQSDGTNWFIIAGEPKREQSWSAGKNTSEAESKAGVEISAIRPAFVMFKGESGGFSIGGVTIAAPREGVPYYVPAGQKWKAGSGLSEVQTLLL